MVQMIRQCTSESPNRAYINVPKSRQCKVPDLQLENSFLQKGVPFYCELLPTEFFKIINAYLPPLGFSFLNKYYLFTVGNLKNI